MWIVLCEPDDRAALWAAAGLRARGLDPLELLTPAALLSEARWEHRLGADGSRVLIDLPGGRTLEDKSIRGILNRVVYLRPALAGRIRPVDRLYVLQEMTALFLSWLSAVPAPVLNRPAPLGLCGAWRHPSEWAMLAEQSGLLVFPFTQSSRADVLVGTRLVPPSVPVRVVFVVGGRVADRAFAAEGHGGDVRVPDAVARSCVALAARAGVGLLGVEFAQGPHGLWTFAGASPQPDLRLGGDAILDALAAALDEP